MKSNGLEIVRVSVQVVDIIGLKTGSHDRIRPMMSKRRENSVELSVRDFCVNRLWTVMDSAEFYATGSDKQC
jgi:hypothetical protein